MTSLCPKAGLPFSQKEYILLGRSISRRIGPEGLNTQTNTRQGTPNPNPNPDD